MVKIVRIKKREKTSKEGRRWLKVSFGRGGKQIGRLRVDNL